MKIENLSFKTNKIIVNSHSVMWGQPLFISPEDVKWFNKDENGNSVEKEIGIGSIIEFDEDISGATRNLKNVTILS